LSTNGPGVGEVEISLFGPGYGESLAIHLGDGDWMIVDSCLDAATQEPSALVYLRSIGVNPKTAVKLIVATHWHDDHIRGLDTICADCSDATLVISNALRVREFLTLSTVYAENSGMVSGGTDTIYKVIKLGLKSGKVLLALINKPMQIKASLGSHPGYSVTALSPSDHCCIRAQAALGALIPKINKQKTRLRQPDHNETSVALWIELGPRKILLGADLENGAGHPEWSFIVTNTGGKNGAEVFKIPHHGSSNGYNVDVWHHMVIPNAHALITPYSKLVKPLPTPQNVETIKTHTDKVSITRILPFKIGRVPKRGAKNKVLLKVAKNFRKVPLSEGQIRLRSNLSASSVWLVEHIGTASAL